MRLTLLALLLPFTAACLCAETKLVLKKAGVDSLFDLPQVTVPAGERVVLSTPIKSGDVWLKDGHPLPGGFGQTFVIESARPRDSGHYRVSFMSDDVTESQELILTVAPNDAAAGGGRLQTFTTRGIAGMGTQALIAGFVVSETPGQPSATKRVMVRAVGPTLEEFGVTGFLTDPHLSVYDQTGQRCTASTSDAVDIAQAHLKTGAFPLKPGAADVVLLLSLKAGAYTAQVSSEQGSGLVVFDVYELPEDP